MKTLEIGTLKLFWLCGINIERMLGLPFEYQLHACTCLNEFFHMLVKKKLMVEQNGVYQTYHQLLLLMLVEACKYINNIIHIMTTLTISCEITSYVPPSFLSYSVIAVFCAHKTSFFSYWVTFSYNTELILYIAYYLWWKTRCFMSFLSFS